MKKGLSLFGLGFLAGFLVCGLGAMRDARAYQVSNQTCSLRRYAKCTGTGANKKCNGWQPWKDLRNPGNQYSDWKSAASACCRAKGLR